MLGRLFALASMLFVFTVGAPAQQPDAKVQKQIDQLIAQLDAESYASREAATKGLVQLGKMAVPSLHKALKNTDPEVRQRARKALETIQRPPAPRPAPAVKASNIEEFIEQLGDDSYQVRENASKALIQLGRKAIPALKKATKDRSPEISQRAKLALEAIG